MSNSAIFRIIKLKTIDDITRVGKHNDRDKEHLAENVNQKLSKNNVHVKGSGNSLEEWTKRTEGVKIRNSNTVLGYDIVMTFSEETKQMDIKKWRKANVDFLEKKFGEKNVLCVWEHNDESTRHLHALVTPIIFNEKTQKEEFNAKHFTGQYNALSIMQDEYFEAVGKQFELERGVKGSRARHVSLKEYHKQNAISSVRRQAIEEYIDGIPKKNLLGELVAALHRCQTLESQIEKNKSKITELKKSNDSLSQEKLDLQKENDSNHNKIKYFKMKIKFMEARLSPEELQKINETMRNQELLDKLLASLKPEEKEKVKHIEESSPGKTRGKILNTLNPLPPNAYSHKWSYDMLEKSQEVPVCKEVCNKASRNYRYKDAMNSHNYSLGYSIFEALFDTKDAPPANASRSFVNRLEKILEEQGYTQEQIQKIIKRKEQNQEL